MNNNLRSLSQQQGSRQEVSHISINDMIIKCVIRCSHYREACQKQCNITLHLITLIITHCLQLCAPMLGRLDKNYYIKQRKDLCLLVCTTYSHVWYSVE